MMPVRACDCRMPSCAARWVLALTSVEPEAEIRYPAAAVKIMARICEEAELSIDGVTQYKELIRTTLNAEASGTLGVTEAMASSTAVVITTVRHPPPPRRRTGCCAAAYTCMIQGAFELLAGGGQVHHRAGRLWENSTHHRQVSPGRTHRGATLTLALPPSKQKASCVWDF